MSVDYHFNMLKDTINTWYSSLQMASRRLVSRCTFQFNSKEVFPAAVLWTSRGHRCLLSCPPAIVFIFLAILECSISFPLIVDFSSKFCQLALYSCFGDNAIRRPRKQDMCTKYTCRDSSPSAIASRVTVCCRPEQSHSLIMHS